jgi:nucleotide-binding universal stress UspA family protein
MKKAQNDVILIPTDFSEVCQNAIEHGSSIAGIMNYKVVLLHVINKDTDKYLEQESASEESVTEKLSHIASAASKRYNVQIDYLVSKGDLFECIKDANEKVGAKIIMIGTHGKVGFQKVSGSYVLKVISVTGTPTIIVQKKQFSEGYKNIVFPITASTQDRQKVTWAINIAKMFDATVHMIPKFESGRFYKNRIMSITKQIKNLFDEFGVKYVDKVSNPTEGSFAKQVVDYALQNDAELIMTLVNKDKALFFSSWDEKIIYNTAQIPVICINPIETKKTTWNRY